MGFRQLVVESDALYQLYIESLVAESDIINELGTIVSGIHVFARNMSIIFQFIRQEGNRVV